MTAKKIIVLLLVLGVFGGAYGLYLFNKPSGDVSNKKVDLSITASELVSAYKIDETAANIKYLNKVLGIAGIVKSVKVEEGTQNILLETSDMMSAVSCEMSKPVAAIKEGDNINIKGQCAGYLLDVVLTKCVIQK